MSENRDAAPQESFVSKVKAIYEVIKPVVTLVVVIGLGLLKYKGILDSQTFQLALTAVGGTLVAAVQNTQKRIERKADLAIRSLSKQEK